MRFYRCLVLYFCQYFGLTREIEGFNFICYDGGSSALLEGQHATRLLFYHLRVSLNHLDSPYKDSSSQIKFIRTCLLLCIYNTGSTAHVSAVSPLFTC